ncbi:hypothetical protein [Pseudoduganella sp. HUAS MS19]
MRAWPLLSILISFLLAGQAAGACQPLRYGYTDKAVPPYYAGSGAQAPEPPGALAELARDAGASAHCPVRMVRLPPARLHKSLDEGAIDAMSLFDPQVVGELPNVVYPRDRQGRLDAARAMPLYVVVFVRARDRLAPDADPAAAMRGRVIGVSQGAPHIRYLQSAGVEVDAGAANPDLNFEKLRLGRIDGFAISLSMPEDMDAPVAARYGKQFVRLRKPLLVINSWLALNRGYYENNREASEAIWTWYGVHGRARLKTLLKKYRR